MEGYIRKIIPHSAVDGPGNRMAIFLQGCNLNCQYCHNPETIPEIKTGDRYKMSTETLIHEVKKHIDYISGVTFSGGECTLQFDFLYEACLQLQALGVNILIDSNGTLRQGALRQLAGVVDGFMIDFKADHAQVHLALTNGNNDVIKENLIMLAAMKKLYEIRMVIVPDRNDPEAMIEWVATHIMPIDPRVKLELITFRAHGVRRVARDFKSPSNAQMHALLEYAHTLGIEEVIIK